MITDAAREALEQAREAQAAVVAQEQAKLLQIEEALQTLVNTIVVNNVPVRQDFKHMGILEATARLMEETQRPMTTREIADGIRARGVVSRSKSFIPTVYATLTNSPMFDRVGGQWALRATKRRV